MTRLEIATRLLAGWAANPNERGTAEAAAKTALFLADALLAAAEKPAEPLGGWASDGWASEPAEAAPVAAEKCTECGSRNPTHVDVLDGTDGGGACCGGDECCVFAKGLNPSGWRRVPLAVDVAAAPTVAAVVPVKFVADRQAPLEMYASGPGWVAAFSIPAQRITLDIDLRPDEDAGETVAKMLAPVGRGP